MASEQCWAMEADGRRCGQPSVFGDYFCARHGWDTRPTPAQIWRAFMSPALAIDGRTSTSLPSDYRVPRRLPPREERQSPLPEDWTLPPPEWIEDVARQVERMFQSF